MRALLSWVVISLGIGTVTALIRYLAVWYIIRRARRLLRRNPRAEPNDRMAGRAG